MRRAIGPHRRAVVAGLAGGALALAAPGGRAASAGAAAPALRRGVNLSHWFAQSLRGYGPDHLARFVGDAHLRALADARLTHVRLGIEPDLLFPGGGPEPAIAAPVLAAYRGALERIAAHGLAAVVDLHPVGAAKEPLLTPEGATRFVALWSHLAGALARIAHGPGLALEILNEPEPLKGEAWWDLQGRALAAIRAAGAEQPVIVSGGGWSGIDDLVARRPYADRRVVYTVHHYAPLLFTHQGATWTWDVARGVAGLPWPCGPEEAQAVAAAAAGDDRARGFLRDQIAAGDFTEGAMDAQFDRLSSWQAAHGNPPVYVGEFGVYAPRAPAAARLAWVSRARAAFEARGWGWALWDNTAEFGFRAADREIDPAMIRALGSGA